MTVALIGLAVLAVVIFAFVLEPVLRARPEGATLDAVAEPRPAEMLTNDGALSLDDDSDRPSASAGGERDTPLRQPIVVDRPAAGDVS